MSKVNSKGILVIYIRAKSYVIIKKLNVEGAVGIGSFVYEVIGYRDIYKSKVHFRDI